MDSELLKEIRSMGPKVSGEVQALNQLTEPQLARYVVLWKTKNEQAKAETAVVMESQRIEMVSKMEAIRADTTAQLQAAQVEMQTKMQEIQLTAQVELTKLEDEWKQNNKEIKESTKEAVTDIRGRLNQLAKDASDYGAKMWLNYKAGTELGYGQFREELLRMASEVSEIMSTIGGVASYSFGMSGLPAYAAGGKVPVTGPAYLHADERVLTSYTDSMLARLLNNLNNALAYGSLNTPVVATSNNLYFTINGATDAEKVSQMVLRDIRRAGVKI